MYFPVISCTFDTYFGPESFLNYLVFRFSIPLRAYYTWACVIKIPFCTRLKKVIDGTSIPLSVFAIPTRKKSASKTRRSLHPFHLLEYFGGALKHVQNMFVDKKETHFLARREWGMKILLHMKNFITHERKGIRRKTRLEKREFRFSDLVFRFSDLVFQKDQTQYLFFSKGVNRYYAWSFS